ncbi:MAG TPA: hypothetical protein DIT25_03240 [Candidatus Moranbacteria bacterium]|nr:hypothetical protein [Candidatus Moranbacteria bacterium]
MIDKESFPWKNHEKIMEYFKSLMTEINANTQRFTEQSKAYTENGKAILVKGKRLTSRQIIAVCLDVIENEWLIRSLNWNFEPLVMGTDNSIRDILLKLENYLKQIPGTRLPKKDPLIREWLKERRMQNVKKD